MLFPYMIKYGNIFLKYFPVFDLSDLNWNRFNSLGVRFGWGELFGNYPAGPLYIFKSHWIGIRNKLLKI